MSMQRFLLIVLLSLSLGSLAAQDIHFSQFYSTPLHLNPALTGLMPGNFRASAHYKSQWGSVTTPYRTMALSVDGSLFRGLIGDDFVGLGGFIYQDKAGDADLTNTQGLLSASYNKSLNYYQDHFLSFGANIGFGQQSLDYNKLLFDEQFDGDILNPGLSNGESDLRPRYAYFDVSAGLAWFYSPDESTIFYAGLAAAHLNEPDMSFFSDEDDRLYRKFTGYGAIQYQVTANGHIIGRAMYIKQGPSSEINIGALGKFVLSDRFDELDENALYAGVTYRHKDAVVLISRFDYGQIGIGVSYDVNISKLTAASNGRGGFEIALTYNGIFDNGSGDKIIRCPTF